jgi:hypothetical protein
MIEQTIIHLYSYVRTEFFIRHEIVSALKRVKFMRSKVCITLIVPLCDITLPNVHSPTEDKSRDMKNSLWEGLKHEFDQFPKYEMKNL